MTGRDTNNLAALRSHFGMKSAVIMEGPIYVFTNIESGLRLAERVHLAGDSATRRQGLLGLNGLDRQSGLWIIPCEAIHTFGMKMPIDVLFLDRQLKVRKLIEGIPPGRISLCLRATSVIEMPAGAIAESKTEVGHCLEARRLDHAGNAPAAGSTELSSSCQPS